MPAADRGAISCTCCVRDIEVFGADENPEAVEQTRRLAALLAPGLPTSNFRNERVEAMSFPEARARYRDQQCRAPFRSRRR